MIENCPNGGKKVSAESNFCASCGTVLNSSQAEKLQMETSRNMIDFFYTEENRMSRMAYLLSGYQIAVVGVWAFLIFMVMMGVIFGLGFLTRSQGVMLIFPSLFSVLGFAFAIFVCVIAFKAAKRRLHDLNLSARWILYYFIAVIGIFVFCYIRQVNDTLIEMISLLMSIPAFLLYFLPGDQGENQYGQPYSKNLTWKNFFYLDQWRVGRREFFWGNLKNSVLPSFIMGIFGMFSNGIGSVTLLLTYPGLAQEFFSSLFAGTSILIVILGGIVVVGSIIFSFVLGTLLRMRRLQDMGIHKNIVYFPLGILIVMVIFSVTGLLNGMMMLIMGGIIGIFELLCLCKKGNCGENKFGKPYSNPLFRK